MFWEEIEKHLLGNVGMLLKDGTRAEFNIVEIKYMSNGRPLYVTDADGFHIPWEAIVYFKKFDNETETNNG